MAPAAVRRAEVSELVPVRLALQERAHLHEAVVSPAQHGLRLLDRVNLARPRLTPHVEVLEEEITRTMELRDVLTQGHEVTSRALVVLRGLVEVTLQAGLLGLLLRNGLAVTRALLRAVRHQLLVVLLRILLLHVVGLHLHLQVIGQLLDQRRRATSVLLLVRALRRRRSHARLAEHRDARARNTSLGSRGLLSITRIRTTRLHVDALLLSELTALRGVVRGRVVELVQAVLRNAQELHRGVVLRLHRGVLRVLSLTGLRRLGDRLVQSNDAVAQGLDIVLKRSNALLHLRNRGLQTRDLALELALLVLRGVELRLAPLLLRLVLLLLLLQQDNHVIDHLDDLLETSLLAHQRELDHAELRRVLLVLQVRERREGLVAHVAVRLRHLEQARRRKGLLEQVQGIIIVQDLDGLRNRNRLLRAARLALLVVLLRRGAALLQLGHELLVLAQGILRILQIVLQVDDLHRHLAVLLHLRLDRLRGRLDLLLLRSHQRVEFRLRGVLRLGSVSELLLHVLQKLLQNAHDLARRRRVARRRQRRQELRQHAASVAVQRVA